MEGTNKTLCAPGPRRKEQGPHETESDLPVSVQESPARSWVDLLSGSGTLTAAVLEGIACWHKPFWRRSPLPLPYFRLRTNYREQTQFHPPAPKLD